MDAIREDLRFTFRKLARSPGFLAVALLSLGLGIGANTIVFSLIDAVLLRPLDVHEPDRLVALYSSREGKPFRSSTYADFIDYQHPEFFTGLAAYRAWEFSMATEDTSQLLTGELVSANYFEVLGVRPAHGRTLAASTPETPAPIAVIGHLLWQRAFGADPRTVGKTVRLNGHSFTIAGVAPPGFRGPSLGSRPEIWVPFHNYEKVATGFWSHFEAVSYDEQRSKGGNRIAMWELVGRLRPGVGLERARSMLAATDLALAERYPETNEGQRATLVPAVAAATPLAHRGEATRFVLLLLAAVGAALLIACTNLASLLLARADARRPEIGVRLAMGASRGRLVRQLLTESVVLATLGAGAGLMLTGWGFDLLAPFRLPGGIAVGDLGLEIDLRILAFSTVAAVVTGLLFGLAPALLASRSDPLSALRGRAATRGRASGRLRAALVAVQVATAVVLLVGAGLFARSLDRGLATDLGFDPEGVLTMTFDLGLERYDKPRAEAWYTELLERVRATPGVLAASATSSPFGHPGPGIDGVVVEGRGRLESDRITLSKVEADYFETMGLPLLDGRDFDARDTATGQKVLIINETMARTFWPGARAVGQRINFAGPDSPYFEIVGVAADSTYWSLQENPQRYVYMPLAQHWSHAAGNETTLVVRTSGEPSALAGTIGHLVRQLDRHVPIAHVATLRDRVAETLMPQRMGTVFLGLFSMMAMVLASVGIFGVVAYAVGHRTREIGLRMALGADSRAVVGTFLRRGLTPVALGLAAGLAAAAAATRWIEAFLYQVVPLDPATFSTAAVLLLAIASLACWLPARKAAGVDPIVALRHE